MREHHHTLRVLIADDEPPARRQLRRVLQSLIDVELVGEAGDGLEALRLVEALRPDVLILDIQMPEMSGLDVAANLGPPAPHVIFATAFDEHAIRAFDLAAVDYLLKPWDDERLLRALERVRERMLRNEVPRGSRLGPVRRVLVRQGGALLVINCDEILCIVAHDNYVILHTTNGSRMLREPIGVLVDRLQHPDLVRVHRSHAVNLRYVTALASLARGDSEIVLSDDRRVPCSRTYRGEIQKRLSQPL